MHNRPQQTLIAIPVHLPTVREGTVHFTFITPMPLARVSLILKNVGATVNWKITGGAAAGRIVILPVTPQIPYRPVTLPTLLARRPAVNRHRWVQITGRNWYAVYHLRRPCLHSPG